MKVFNTEELNNLDPDEMRAYQASLKIARDNYSHDETVRSEGRLEGWLESKIEGRHEKAIEIALAMLAEKEPIEKIVQYSGLSAEEIKAL